MVVAPLFFVVSIIHREFTSPHYARFTIEKDRMYGYSLLTSPAILVMTDILHIYCFLFWLLLQFYLIVMRQKLWI